MANTFHKIIIGAAQKLNEIKDNSINLVVTSPPYPMIEMWDDVFSEQNHDIMGAIKNAPQDAFELMHRELDKAWEECYRVLLPGGFLCINIGDATRTINGQFKLYDNHVRVSTKCQALDFVSLPCILWRKQTNAPNKFMGSGMLPCGAYVTLEHEWILIFRKGGRRKFETVEDKLKRMKSAFLWEERNVWFSDVWEVKGVKQTLQRVNTRERSAAYPIEIPFRLINMFTQKGDTVLDPFLGTGTTIQAAILTERNSCGYDIDANFERIIRDSIEKLDLDLCNASIRKRLDAHREFVEDRESNGKEIKYFNGNLNNKVMTKQETEIELNFLNSIRYDKIYGGYVVEYEDTRDLQ